MDNVYVSKGAVLRKLDAAWSALTIADCDQLIRELEDKNVDHVETLVAQGIYTQAEADHIKLHWYSGDEHGFWPMMKNKQEILRAGYTRAAHIVRDSITTGSAPLPIVSYWICSGGNYQSLALKSDHQVTVVLLTPFVSQAFGAAMPPNTVQEDIWMIANESDIDAARQPALQDWFNRHDRLPSKDRTGWKDVFETQLFGN